mmetsp:Transcript_26797/g.61746  ORF Transcript_26797/g.61746 Transcript_26797/m.61746 type:complete len:185 (+) Transcript_26797:16-570(+)
MLRNVLMLVYPLILLFMEKGSAALKQHDIPLIQQLHAHVQQFVDPEVLTLALLGCLLALSAINVLKCFWSGRWYTTSEGRFLWKWDPSNLSLTFACLFNPLQLALILLRSHLNMTFGVVPALSIATTHGLMLMVLSSRFLEKERVTRVLVSEVSQIQQDYYDRSFRARIAAEGQYISELQKKQA